MSDAVAELYSDAIQPLSRREQMELAELIHHGLEQNRDELPADWDEKNARRWSLIMKKMRESLTKAEKTELGKLQKIAEDWLSSNSIYPTDEIEGKILELEQNLKEG